MRIPLRNVQAWMQKREPYSPWPNHEQDDRIIEENGDVHDFSDDRKELFTGPGESKSSTAQTALAYKQSTELVIDLNHETLRRQLRYNVDGQKDDKSWEPLPNTVREIHVKKDNSILSSGQSKYAESHDNVKNYNDDTVPPPSIK